MIKFDFSTTINSFINHNDKRMLEDRKEEIYSKFLSSDMIGWTKKQDEDLINRIKKVSNEIKVHSKCLVVIGIGGSYMASYALKKLFSPYLNDLSFPVIYAGNTLSSEYMDELLKYLENIDFSLQVISKSGNTMEVIIAYQLIKQLMERKYSKEELKKRIIITTNSKEGKLRQEAEENQYPCFDMREDIGGRYSLMTPAHLLSLSLNIDIEKLMTGYYQGKKYQEEAYTYAVVRRCLFKQRKYIENYCIYEDKMYYFTEWLKQLFAESEGKDQKGIFPVSTVNTRDLHSLGQFIQEGNKIIFETFIKVNNSSSKLSYMNQELHKINNTVLDSVRKAHYFGNVPCNLIEIDSICEETIGELMYFFMMSAVFSSYLFEVCPFDQPGVEVYKTEVSKNLNL